MECTPSVFSGFASARLCQQDLSHKRGMYAGIYAGSREFRCMLQGSDSQNNKQAGLAKRSSRNIVSLRSREGVFTMMIHMLQFNNRT